MSERVAALAAVVSVLATGTALVLGGGLLATLAFDTHIAAEPMSPRLLYECGAVAFAVLLAVVSSRHLLRHKNRRPLLGSIVLSAGFVAAVLAGELLLRTKLPAWPARALHGVSPQQWAAATQPGQGAAPTTLNNWGQRDRERTQWPQPGVQRIAFIGDSFLEEGANVPVSLATEKKIGRRDLEVFNLGVSATGPDEYFDRLRSVATPLGVSHCYLFIFAGNDFVSPARTLLSYDGIASVEPRCSLLTSIGLAGWNHALTNRHRPVIQAWMQSGQLAQDEMQRAEALSQASDDQMRLMLLGAAGMEGDAYDRLAATLSRDGIEPVFEMLRNPDEGKFRSYYLSAALSAAADENWSWEPNSAEIAWQWTEQAAQYCRRHRIGLTVVVIPEAFQIDDRMRDQWRPLADMRKATAPCRQAAADFVGRLRTAKLDVIDLHKGLRGLRGTYLNMDGHWSTAGVDAVSALLAKHWNERGSTAGVAVHE